MGDITIVQEFLLHTLQNIKYDGQCPLRIGQKYFLLKYFGLNGPQGPTYIEDKYVSIPMDSNSLIIIVFALFLKTTNNTKFASKYYHQLKCAINWYNHHLINGLVNEGPYAGWADSVKKRGAVLYTNVLYFEALKCMEFIATELNILSDIRHFNSQKDNLKSKIQKTTAFPPKNRHHVNSSYISGTPRANPPTGSCEKVYNMNLLPNINRASAGGNIMWQSWILDHSGGLPMQDNCYVDTTER